MTRGFKVVILHVFIAANIRNSLQNPADDIEDVKAAYKIGDVLNTGTIVTLDKIKQRLKDTGIFDWTDPTLTATEKKELSKLFEAVEIMTTSRARQPSNVQNMFYSIRVVERAVKKQLKEGQISETLAAKFNWDKISNRQKRQYPAYYIDKDTNMRVFEI